MKNPVNGKPVGNGKTAPSGEWPKGKATTSAPSTPPHMKGQPKAHAKREAN
jgi:hypothetical protein